ncbi:single-stranded DNA-binding protein [Patescibacteria group bacterium]
MSARSVNKVIIIGNLTRDPELRYTPQGTPVCSFGIATNREWSVDGIKKEAADFHNAVAWNKLAELCAQLLAKGSKTYVEGRLQTRDWTDADGNKRYKTEIVVNEMIVLSPLRGGTSSSEYSQEVPAKDVVDDDLDLDDVLSDLADEDEVALEEEPAEEEEKEEEEETKKKKKK